VAVATLMAMVPIKKNWATIARVTIKGNPKGVAADNRTKHGGLIYVLSAISA